jgi:Fe-S-cluster containining protein
MSEPVERPCHDTEEELPTFPAHIEVLALAAALRAAASRGTPFWEETAAAARGPARLPLAPPELELRFGPDKYTLAGLPEIDCAARLDLCKARCCHFTFVLTQQDVDEGVVRWDRDQPYRIQRRGDCSCIHLEGGACSIYAERPAVCRNYDCRHDRRIWKDFDLRIPAD